MFIDIESETTFTLSVPIYVMRILDLKILLIMFKRLNAVHLSGTNVKRYLDLKYLDQSERMHVFQGRESKKNMTSSPQLRGKLNEK